MEALHNIINYLHNIYKYHKHDDLDFNYIFYNNNKFVNQHIFNINSQNEYIKELTLNYIKLEEISNNVYNNNNEHKLISINILDIFTNKKKLHQDLYKYEISNIDEKKNIIKKYEKVELFSKIKNKNKNKNKNDINNYRFIANHTDFIKIIDRIYILKVITLLGDDFINKDIFKASIKNNFNDACITTANENTKSIDNVILLDLSKAFDSVDWNILRELLIRAYIRKLPLELAISLADEYIVMLINRNFSYKNNNIIVQRGISQGLPSSIFIFTIMLQEIIFEFLLNIKYKINIDFKLNIYIDDIYFKLFKENINNLIFDFIDIIKKYKLNINFQKSKADSKLNIQEFNVLQKNDQYLGIWMTRNIDEYKQYIIIEYYNNHISKINEFSIEVSWKNFYTILNNKTLNIKLINHIRGYLNYKLKPLMLDVYKNDNYDCTDNNLQKFIKDYLI